MIIIYISAAVFILLIFSIFIYNRLVSLKARVDEAWSGIDVQLKKRYELIPNLVGAVEKFAEFEKSLMTGVTELRTRGIATASVAGQGEINNQLEPQIGTIFVNIEKYPDVKTSRNIIELQNQFVAIEETIHYARKYYNGTVRNYNIAINVFPNSLLAALLGLKPAEYFQADEAARGDITL
jgi:LemA protein